MLVLLACSRPGPDSPNIVVIVSDDQPHYALGAAGDPVIRTPELDALAREGAYFPRTYLTNGTCAPSRSSFVTGRMPHETGLEKNGQGIDLDLPLLPRLLQSAGYYTAMVGKCHLGPIEGYDDPDAEFPDPPPNPDSFAVELGFDHRTLFYPDMGWIPDWYAYDLVVNGVPESVSGSYVTNELTDRALAVLEERPDGQPVFLWLAYTAAHEPYVDRNRPPDFQFVRGYEIEQMPPPPSEHDDLATKPPQQTASRPHQNYLGLDPGIPLEWKRLAYEMIENLDGNVGRLVDHLDELDEDTVVVFLSDNGVFFGEHQMVRKGATFYEEQLRTPLIVRDSRMPARGRIDALVSSLDLMPTLLDVAGVRIPDDVRGTSLVPLIDGTTDAVHDSVFMEYAGWRQYDFAMRGVVWGDYKLVHYLQTDGYDDFGFELYDLSADPYEIDNLMFARSWASILDDPAHGSAARTLRREMAWWQSSTDDPAGVAMEVAVSGLGVTVTTATPTTLEVDCAACEVPSELATEHVFTLDAAGEVDVYAFSESGRGAHRRLP